MWFKLSIIRKQTLENLISNARPTWNTTINLIYKSGLQGLCSAQKSFQNQILHSQDMGSTDKRQLLLISSSNVHGYDYLAYAENDIKDFFKTANVKRILFVPYALKDHDAYLKKVSNALKKWDFDVDGIHKDDPIKAVENAEAIFIGGGNTFLLLKTLYDKNLVALIKRRVFEDGIPYMGTSAGTNVAGMAINNTNDMPIVYPPSFDGLQLIPFNINPHYIDTDLNSTHKGETREERILQYQEMNESNTVLAMREGCALLVNGDKFTLKGIKGARLYLRGAKPTEYAPDSDVSFLNKP